MANTNRRKGHDYERQRRLEYRDMGWNNCETSRYKSKYLDDHKIDLTDTYPFSIQAKCTKNNPSYHKIFKEMLEIKGHYKLIYHKKPRDKEYVVIQKEDFHELLDMLIKNSIINP